MLRHCLLDIQWARSQHTRSRRYLLGQILLSAPFAAPMSRIMPRLLLSLLVLSFSICLSSLRAASPTAHIDDPHSLLPPDLKWTKAWDQKLSEFEQAHRIKIFVEFHPKSPSEEEDKKPGAYMQALSLKRGVDRKGVLVVYFADEDDWRVWISDDLTAIFAGHEGTAEELTKSGAMHREKEAFLKGAHDKAEAAFDAQKRAATAQQQPGAAQRVRLNTEALLSDLLVKLGKTDGDRR
jgi:hypothetical protein